MKTSPIALALLVVGGLAAPVLAADSSFDSDWYVTQLQQRGIEAVAANEDGDNTLRATVVLADGSQVFQYYYSDTLQPVSASKGGNTRVLSKLDTGATSAPASTDSLLVDNFFD